MTQTATKDLTLQEFQQDMGAERITDSSHLMPVANFTDCKQAAALVEKFGDKDLAKLSDIDQAALLCILSAIVYRDVCTTGKQPLTIWEAADRAIPEDEDHTSEAMEDALEALEGIDPDDAIALIQFLVQ